MNLYIPKLGENAMTATLKAAPPRKRFALHAQWMPTRAWKDIEAADRRDAALMLRYTRAVVNSHKDEDK